MLVTSPPCKSWIANARAAIVDAFATTGTFKPTSVSVRVTGTAFLHDFHGQHVDAADRIERHPAIEAAFILVGGPLATPSVVAIACYSEAISPYSLPTYAG